MIDVRGRKTVAAGGHAIAYQESGPAHGPVLVLLHGLASDSDTWDRVIGPLGARGVRVLAVDLLGHGGSDKPTADYLLDDFAESLVAFLDALDVPAATLCGHSLGGAIAMHVGFQHPERMRRLVLVSAGGLGRELHPLLRAAALPVAPIVVRLAMRPWIRRWYAHPRLHRALRLTPDNLVNLRRAGRALESAAGQAAFFASLRGVATSAGQRGSFIDMQALAEHTPTLLIWNADDPVIPVTHAQAAASYLRSHRLVVFPGGGHEPHRRNAALFADEVAGFVLAS